MQIPPVPVWLPQMLQKGSGMGRILLVHLPQIPADPAASPPQTRQREGKMRELMPLSIEKAYHTLPKSHNTNRPSASGTRYQVKKKDFFHNLGPGA
jgi:hypothetical protein